MWFDQITRISTASDGSQRTTPSYLAVTSDDARYVAFVGFASSAPGSPSDIFVKDLMTGTLTLVPANGVATGGPILVPAISGNGRFVVFPSTASDLVGGDTNGVADLFVRDLQTGITTMVSTAAGGATGNGASSSGSVSDDGRYIVFQSDATNLVADDTNGVTDVFVKDTVTGTVTLVSTNGDGAQGNGDNDSDYYGPPLLSGDGRYVLFSSDATNLVPDDGNGQNDIFLKDLETGAIQLVTTASDGTQANSDSYAESMTPDGRYVVFSSWASNLVPNDTNNNRDVFVKDLLTGVTTRVSTASDGAQAAGGYGHLSHGGSISDDGRYVAFAAGAPNLVRGDTNYQDDIFVKDLLTGLTSRVSLGAYGAQGNGDSWNVTISSDGQSVVFTSRSNNLVPGDTNNHTDIFIAAVHPDRIGTTAADHFFNINIADTVHALAGNDHIEVWTAPALVDGGAGSDIVRLKADVTLAAGSLVGVETIYAETNTTSDLSAIDYGLRIKSLSRAGDHVSVTGTGFDDLFTGASGTDSFIGGAGIDRFIALNAGDSAAGGSGDDRYYVGAAGAAVSEAVGQGIDIVYARASYALAGGSDIEVLRAYGATTGFELTGNEIANRIVGGAHGDTLNGAGGADRLEGGAGNDRLTGGLGSDLLFGQAGDDTYVVDSSGDRLIERLDEGADIVLSSVTWTLGTNLERLTLTGAGNISGTGNDLANLIKGNGGNNILAGRAGDDKLYGYAGADVVKGEDGNDWLEGGAGRDRFYGGAGTDSFVFRDGDLAGVTSATCDQIHDFDETAEVIGLSLVDANSGVAGDQAFAFLGTAAFTGAAGELRYEQISGNTYVQGDTNGDGSADFWIRLDGLHTLASDDFVF